ncbi:vacuolar H+/Ca2+ exchanger [Cadophora sp. DSE1049]|nr:vacuolar H+/Ca2+ exchanger [Cadophora sp. DSE1049]
MSPSDHHHARNREDPGSPTETHALLPSFLPQTIHPDGESGRRGFNPVHFFSVLWRSSNQVSMAVNFLWPFCFLAIIMNFATPHLNIWVFVVSYIGMIPAANLLGFAGQEFARKMPKVSGILIETTFGSIVEIVLFLILIIKHKAGSDEDAAEHGNLIPIIQAAILGSILTNLLLCLGLCFAVGGIRQQVQTFHAAVSEVGNGLLLVAGFGLLIPSAFYSALKGSAIPQSTEPPRHHGFTDKKLEHDILGISRITSILLIIAFGMYIWYNARTNHSIFDEVLEQDEHDDLDHHVDLAKPKFTLTECMVAITGSIILVTVLAVFLVNRIEDVVEAGIPDQFLGLILLPLVEKAAEHLTAVDEAWDGQMNFALYHCLGPSIQTALFNAPLVVIVGWVLGKPMDLNFEIFMIVLLVLSITVVGNFLRDGESNALEGGLLVIVYFIIAVAAWYYPDPDVATSNGIAFTSGLYK